MLDMLYLVGTSFLWYGLIAHVMRLAKRKSSGDLSLAFLGAQAIANTLMLPLAVYSGVAVWMIGHAVILSLCVTLFILAWRYRHKKSKEDPVQLTTSQIIINHRIEEDMY